jgi:hypothetical protein
VTEPKSEFITRAKISAIASESQLALNTGSSAGVRKGDLVTLYRQVDVTDPDSGEELGTVSFPRLTLRVNHVQDKLSVAIVTDFETVREQPFDVTSVRRLKRVTLDPREENKGTVLVEIGESVVIRREPKPEEPPF